MAIITYPITRLKDRDYLDHTYAVQRYQNSGKVNVRVTEKTNSIFLKMSLAETKDLITQLQFAVYEAENGL